MEEPLEGERLKKVALVLGLIRLSKWKHSEKALSNASLNLEDVAIWLSAVAENHEAVDFAKWLVCKLVDTSPFPYAYYGLALCAAKNNDNGKLFKFLNSDLGLHEDLFCFFACMDSKSPTEKRARLFKEERKQSCAENRARRLLSCAIRHNNAPVALWCMTHLCSILHCGVDDFSSVAEHCDYAFFATMSENELWEESLHNCMESCRSREAIVNSAIKAGNLASLQYLESNANIVFEQKFVWTAVEAEQLKIVQFLHHTYCRDDAIKPISVFPWEEYINKCTDQEWSEGLQYAE